MVGRGRAGDLRVNPPTVASSEAIPTCESSGAAPLGIEPDSPWWEASDLATTRPRPLVNAKNSRGDYGVTSCVEEFNSTMASWRVETVGRLLGRVSISTILSRESTLSPNLARALLPALSCSRSVELRQPPSFSQIDYGAAPECKGREETGNTREDPPTNGIVRYDSFTRENPRTTPPRIEPGSPWWKASDLSTTPPWPHFLGNELGKKKQNQYYNTYPLLPTKWRHVPPTCRDAIRQSAHGNFLVSWQPSNKGKFCSTQQLIRYRPFTRHDGNTACLARRSDETLDVRVSLARIAPSLLDLGRGVPTCLTRAGAGGREVAVSGFPSAAERYLLRRRKLLPVPPSPPPSPFSLFSHTEVTVLHGLFRAGSLHAGRGVALTEQSDCSPPTNVNRVQSRPVRIAPDDAASRPIFSEIFCFTHLLHSCAASFSPHFSLIGSEDLAIHGRLVSLQTAVPLEAHGNGSTPGSCRDGLCASCGATWLRSGTGSRHRAWRSRVGTSWSRLTRAWSCSKDLTLHLLATARELTLMYATTSSRASSSPEPSRSQSENGYAHIKGVVTTFLYCVLTDSCDFSLELRALHSSRCLIARHSGRCSPDPGPFGNPRNNTGEAMAYPAGALNSVPVACGKLLQGKLVLAHYCTFSVRATGASNHRAA
ncbi:hypothetical protein PR048_009629 [Dryococelus australis]|uniref:Uncharacterized protein n=1 Tax=Dryococelus australis TaxID=614101 RepID=A0ABQ9I0T9_9NEOP|nr:hypothetical protein PR048_009629 [Dryococelus australis]